MQDIADDVFLNENNFTTRSDPSEKTLDCINSDESLKKIQNRVNEFREKSLSKKKILSEKTKILRIKVQASDLGEAEVPIKKILKSYQEAIDFSFSRANYLESTLDTFQEKLLQLNKSKVIFEKEKKEFQSKIYLLEQEIINQQYLLEKYEERNSDAEIKDLKSAQNKMLQELTQKYQDDAISERKSSNEYYQKSINDLRNIIDEKDRSLLRLQAKINSADWQTMNNSSINPNEEASAKRLLELEETSLSKNIENENLKSQLEEERTRFEDSNRKLREDLESKELIIKTFESDETQKNHRQEATLKLPDNQYNVEIENIAKDINKVLDQEKFEGLNKILVIATNELKEVVNKQTIQNSQLKVQLESSANNESSLKEQINDNKKLIHKLETDLFSLSAVSQNGSFAVKPGVKFSTPTTKTELSLKHMLATVSSQRDRLRDSLHAAQSKLEKLSQANQQINSSLINHKDDNQKLYQRIRFLENYKQSERSTLLADIERNDLGVAKHGLGRGVAHKLKGFYEDDRHQNSFKVFSSQDKLRILKRGALSEILSIRILEPLLKNKKGRIFLGYYIIVSHTLFLILFVTL